ncbi:MAG: rhodanese-like domain-containing protein [Gammaproteobacteria bacterium]|jgi:predicted sulfurtransferase
MKQRPNQTIAMMLSVMVILLVQEVMAADKPKEFPGRDIYPEVPYIELQDFYQKLKRNEVVVVDVRSTYEYQTLRIKGAKNIPLASKTFVADMRKLRESENRPIVVYCNGKTCMKSYKAARKCIVEKIPDVTSYDAGIMDFAKTYPKDAMLLGKPLHDPKKLISKEVFKQHLIDPEKFGDRIAKTSDIVLDVRDRFQREGISIFVGREYRVPIDNTRRLDRFIDKAKRENKALLIYDAAGKQVRWLQYYLEDRGLKSYYFMKGGIRAYYKNIKSDFKI